MTATGGANWSDMGTIGLVCTDLFVAMKDMKVHALTLVKLVINASVKKQ